ncbi:MAG: hypothetical protein LT105_06575 [Lentimicrobium sp.]|nr:hypothetical protein [Lentimicrobium sp.]
MKNISSKVLWIITIVAIVGILNSCGSGKQVKDTANLTNESEILYNYLKESGNYINQPATPAIMTASDFIQIMDSQKIMVIDLRDSEQYAAGHVKGAVNVQPANVQEFFRNHIDAPSFERVVFLCNRGQLSAYVSGVMRLLGNSNTWAVRFGMSSLDSAMAKGWDGVIGNHPEAITDTANVALPAKGSLPIVATGGTSAYAIAAIQAGKLLAEDSKESLIEYAEVMKNPEAYHIVAYVAPEHYNKSGHLPGAVRFTPKKSFDLNAELLTLPADKPIVVYCFNGHHSAQATAYLRMLGYDARSLMYGGNAFMHDFLMKNDAGTPRYWSELQKNNVKLVSSGASAATGDNKKTEVKKAAGGC